MAIIHNQINNLWYKPSLAKFKQSPFVKQVFTKEDADDFLKTGAYLIKEAEKLSNIHIPWNESRRFEILANPRLENAFVSLGAEYLLKGVFLKNGYAINKPLIRLGNHPVKVWGNKRKLNLSEVQELGYIITHLPKIIDFGEFDRKQEKEEKKAKKQMKGERPNGITRMTIPYPTSKQLLEYILFKRNYSLHRPFIISEFRGITKQLFNFLDYIAKNGTGKKIETLAKLTE